MQTFDFFVIGGGSGGVRAARIAASHGAKVGLAEASALGGTCVNVGCVPKKLFSYAADYGASLSDMRGYGWVTSGAHFDWATLRQQKDHEITRLNTVYKDVLTKAGVVLFSGFARFIDDHHVQIGEDIISAKTILIATGGRPRQPEFEGHAHVCVSDDIFSMEILPKKVVIQGGGYIGIEFAHILHGLGCQVTILHRGDLWLRGFDHDIANALHDEYIKQGIDVRFCTDISSIQPARNGYLVRLNHGEPLSADMVLSAIGRAPNTEGLGLDCTGIQLSANGRIIVNDNWQTHLPHVYAIGDVCNAHNLTPYAIAEGHILADRLYGNGTVRDVNLSIIPTAIFSNPPIGTVGIREEEAHEQGLDIKIFKTSFRPMRHTLSGRDEKTFMKLIVCGQTNKIIGCHIMGADAPEMLQGIAISMNAGATKADFDRTIGIHPTSAEELVTLK